MNTQNNTNSRERKKEDSSLSPKQNFGKNNKENQFKTKFNSGKKKKNGENFKQRKRNDPDTKIPSKDLKTNKKKRINKVGSQKTENSTIPRLLNNHSKEEPLQVNNNEEMSSFERFGFNDAIRRAIKKVGYTSPTLIQEQAIQPVLNSTDLLGISKTGSGKTAAFILPLLQIYSNIDLKEATSPKILIITPTRELAIQIGVNVEKYGKYTGIKQTTIYGGVSQHEQVKKLRNKDSIFLIATPGRLLDLINQGHVDLNSVKTLILDEADRMLDMGFIPDMKKIVAYTSQREQTLLFSATMPEKILELANEFLKSDFVHVTGDQQSIPVDKINQEIFFVENREKFNLLKAILEQEQNHRVLIFTRTKYGADKLARKLSSKRSRIEAIHGNKSQQNRQKSLKNFRINRSNILVATDLAARGLDVKDITHVVNYDLPREAETYIHRIGRTARAGKSGYAISFCSKDERKFLPQIEVLMGNHIPRAKENPFQSEFQEPILANLNRKVKPRRYKIRKRNKSAKAKNRKRNVN